MTDMGRRRPRAVGRSRSNGAAANGQAIGLHRGEKTAAPPEAAELAVAVTDPNHDRVRLGLELDQLRAERARLLEAREELAATLEERTRRAQQLLGERAQLETRLRERDEQIQRLNRELGAATIRPAPKPRGLQVGARIAALAGRLGALRPVQRDGPEKAPMPTPSPTPGWGTPLQPFVKEGAAQPLIVVVALGLGRDDLSTVLELVTRYCRDQAMRPLLLTDDDGLETLRARRMLFEYLPPPASQARVAPDLDWDLYLQRRLALLRRKWQPARVIAFGAPAARVARLWRSSPFEDASINGLLGIADGTAAL